MKVVAFILEYAVIDRIIGNLKLRFIAERPPPSRVFTEIGLMAAASACTHGNVLSSSMSAPEEDGEYEWKKEISIRRTRKDEPSVLLSDVLFP